MTDSAKKHYDHHLADIYSWMTGNLQQSVEDLCLILDRLSVENGDKATAIDIGAGHGISTLALTERGYHVVAIDFNDSLLRELADNTQKCSVEYKLDDMRNILNYKRLNPKLITCLGDTICHLANVAEIEAFLSDCKTVLQSKGSLILSFRDYSKPLYGTDRFIPVKNDENRHLTCVLEYDDTHVTVTDLIHEKSMDGWVQKVSSYKKPIISVDDIIGILQNNNMQVLNRHTSKGMNFILAQSMD